MAANDQMYPADMPMDQPIDTGTPAPTGKHINWGSVVKGVAIVTAVVLVGVVAAPLAVHAMTAGVAAVNGIPVLGPIVAWTANAAVATTAFTAHAIMAGAAAVWGGLVGLFAGAPVLAPAAVHGTGIATGAVVAGGAVAASIPLAHKAAMGLHYMDPNTPHMATPGMDDGSAVSVMSAKKATFSDNGVVETQTATAKVGHHAGEEGHDHHGAAWLQRVTSNSAFKQNLAASGSYQNAVLAGQAGAPGVQQRNSWYSEQLNADRIALENSLKDSSRA